MGTARRVVNQAGGLFLAVLAVAIAVVVVYRVFFMPTFPGTPNIAHAGGAIGGRVYTNSIAAFEGSAARGYTLFEVDFQKTSDGVVVCGHDWDDLPGGAPSLDAFVADRGPREACLLDELFDWMDANPTAVLVSDAKVDVLEINAMLRQRLGDRLLPQAYDAVQARQMLAAGSPSVILTLYRLDGLEAAMREVDAVAELGERLYAVTIPGSMAIGGLAVWTKFQTGRPAYSHTINDCFLAGILGAMGVDGFYTDDLPPGGC